MAQAVRSLTETPGSSQAERRRMQDLIMQFREHLKRAVVGWLDSRLTRRVDASDIVQETLLQTAVRWPQTHLLADSDAQRLMYCIAKRRCLDAYRRHVRADRRTVLRERRWANPPSSGCAQHWPGVVVSRSTTPGGSVMRQELLERVEDALAQLAPLDRRILELRHLQELAVGEVATRLHLTPTAVTTRHHRAIVQLRKLLDLDR